MALASGFPPVDERQWRALVDKALKGRDFEQELRSRTYDGLTIQPLYTAKDEVGAPWRALPVERPWDVRQMQAQAEPAFLNAALREDLEGGATSAIIRLAAPEQVGLRLRTDGDLAAALDGIDLERTSIWLEAGINASAAADALMAVWSSRKLDGARLRGGLGIDPLGSLAAAGGLPTALDQALDEGVQRAGALHDRHPRVTAMLVDTRPYHDGGASEAQELACLCATTVAYLRALTDGGMAVEAAFRHLSYSLAADADIFLTIAKLRAARALLARIAAACGTGAGTVDGIRLHVMTSLRMVTRFEPHMNMLRTTIACAGAALGGADAITVLPHTVALGQPDDFARRIARNIQLVLQEEAHLGRVADPAGGSWHVDSVTNALAATAWRLFQEIEAQGGMAAALARGHIQSMVRVSAEERAKGIALAKEKIIGVNAFANLSESVPEAEPWPPAEALDDPAVTVEPVPLRRPAEPFEALRDACDRHLERHGRRPAVFVAVLGSPGEAGERATFAARFFAAGGIETAGGEPVASAETAAAVFAQSGARIACLCGSDRAYAEHAAAAATALAATGAAHIYLVGRPGERRGELRAAGVGTVIHEGCDMLQTLREAHDILGLSRAR